jgi:hypothetical protein
MGTRAIQSHQPWICLHNRQVPKFPLSAPSVSLLRSGPAWSSHWAFNVDGGPAVGRFATIRGITNVAGHD